MHRILRETHKKENINLLKARDVYFDKARIQNNRYRMFFLMTPIVLSLIGIIIVAFSHFYPYVGIINSTGNFVNQYQVTIIGVTALITFVADCIITLKISENLSRSNRLQELYDCKVLQIDKNPFLFSNLESTIQNDLKVSVQKPDEPKYEAWYGETFSDNEFANAICAMMDNVIYTYYIYKEYSRKLNVKLVVYTILFIAYTAYFFVSPHNIAVRLINPFILLLAVFNRIKDLIASYLASKDLEKTNKNLIDNIQRNDFEILKISDNGKDNRKILLRSMQDVITRNRDNSLFVPKSIREKYLQNNNCYYQDLDKVKNSLWKETTIEKPLYSTDYEIPTIEDDSAFVSMGSVHEELLNMLKDVKTVLDEAGVRFMLDGGTLIGSVREPNHGFLAWDEDVDISIQNNDVERAISVIRSKLGDKYEIQDCASEEYYSPRLSRFRVRQKNKVSCMSERDSELYELYHSRGLFLDIYAYSPILMCKFVDSAFRKIMFHPLYKKLRETEKSWKYSAVTKTGKEKCLTKFLKLKRRFEKRKNWYLKHTGCTKYYTYIPGWIENLKKAGPYIKEEDIYGEKKWSMFEQMQFRIPSRPDKVLRAFYGKNWNKSPYKSLKDIKNDSGWYKFSSDTFNATYYKHAKNISIYKDI